MPSEYLGDVVVVSPTPTHPHDFGNRKRIYRMTKNLQEQGYRIHFILYPLEDPWRRTFPESEYRAMLEEWDEFHLVIPTVPYHKAPAGADHTLDEWWDVGLEKFLWWYLRSRRFSAVLVNYIYLSRALTLAPKGTLKILDTHDRFGGRRDALAKLGLGPEFFHLTDADEIQGLNRADVTVAIKDEERLHFSRVSDSHCICVPHSDGLPRASGPEPDGEGYLRLGMIGGRNNINRQSAQNFLDLLIPRIFATGAPIKVVLAGSMCTDLEKYTGKFCVESMGYLDDVADFYDAIDVSVVPIDVSTGQKIKVAEALAFGVPLVSHVHAFEGFQSEEPMHLCQSVEDIVEACIDLSFDQERLPHLARKSRIAATHQESVFTAAMAELAGLIRETPAAMVAVDGQRYLGDPALRHHVHAFCETLSTLTGVDVLFSGCETGDLNDVESRAAVARLRTMSALHFAPSATDAAARIGDRHKFLWLVTDLPGLEDALADWTGTLIRIPAFMDMSRQHLPGFESALSGAAVISDKSGILPDRPITLPVKLFKGIDLSPKKDTPAPKSGVALALLPEALPQRTRRAVLSVLGTFCPPEHRIRVLSETGEPVAGAPEPGDPGRVEYARIADLHPQDLAAPDLVAVDLSCGQPGFAEASALLECLPVRTYRPDQRETFDGLLGHNGVSALELAAWLDALDDPDALPAPAAAEDGMSALYSLLASLA